MFQALFFSPLEPKKQRNKKKRKKRLISGYQYPALTIWSFLLSTCNIIHNFKQSYGARKYFMHCVYRFVSERKRQVQQTRTVSFCVLILI